MRPVGAPGTRKLQDILTDAKVPRHLRDALPLVFANGRLAWVPGIALDVEAAAAPGEAAQHVWLEPPGDIGSRAVPEAAPGAYLVP
jgi:tRNA(Ile)-lysidine synthetase-like protein